MHVHARDPAEVVISHLRPGVDVEMCKRPLPGAPTVGVSSKHQRVNLYYSASDPDGVLRGHEIYTGSDRMSLRLVRALKSL